LFEPSAIWKLYLSRELRSYTRKSDLMVVLLPGMDGTGELFRPFLSSLASTCPVQVIGYPRDTDLTYVQLQQYVLDSLPTGEPITLIAESFSGPIALGLCGFSNLNIRAVVLVCSFASRPLGIIGSMLACLPMTFLFHIKPPKLVVRAFLLGRTAPEELVAATIGAISSVRPGVLAGRLRAALRLSPSQRAAAPTRVIAIFATRDRLLRRAAKRSLEEACPALEEHWVEGPHFALQVAPGKIVGVLRKSGVLGAS
jgi:pimeloyl-ACP methyl ester carboxylesterase